MPDELSVIDFLLLGSSSPTVIEGLSILAVAFFVLEILGIASAANAVMTARTSQGATAWVVALVAVPYFAVPLYWIFGRSKFHGYVHTRREGDENVVALIDDVAQRVKPFEVELGSVIGEARALEELCDLPFTRHNSMKLLVDGPDTFDAIFAAIERARDYVLAEFFIIHDDDLGRKLQQCLIAQAKQGCRVYLLYDEVGSKGITASYIKELKEAGAEVSAMNTTQGRWNRFQLNFRNHRKIVVIDGEEALVGGHNVGDEYVHKDKRLTPWRDTHVQFRGPAALGPQVAFVEDWHWATKSFPQVGWHPKSSGTDDKIVFVLPSGPADEYETCGLFFTHAINSAQRRLWIASPYFVPDEGIINALKLAAMRGVDVRILIPGLADKWFIKLAALAYVEQVTSVGVKMYEFSPGFLHQKVVLIDDGVSVVGTANFDNRSFRLNFEISVITIDRDFATEVERMLLHDLSTSKLLTAEEIAQLPTHYRIGSRVARLFSPVL